MTRTRTYRMAVLVLASILLLTSGTLALAQTLQPVQPIQPLEPVATDEPGIRPGVIATIPPDVLLPTRPSVPTPTPHPARYTPVPTSDTPLGVATTVPVSTEPVEPTPTVMAPNPQPVQPTNPPDTQPTPTPDPNATATITYSAMLCDPQWEGYDAEYDSEGELISWTPRPKAEWDQQCPQPMGPVTFQMFSGWNTLGQLEGRQFVQTDENLATFVVPAGMAYTVFPRAGTFASEGIWCTSTLRPDPWRPTYIGKVSTTRMYLQPDEEAHCVYYFLPPYGTASLTIAMHTCPAGYSPQAANADPLADCSPGYAGTPLRLYDTRGSLPISGWPNGSDPASVTFGLLSSATYTVGVPALTPSFTIGCHATQPLMMGPSQTIVLAAGENRTCDWFIVPYS